MSGIKYPIRLEDAKKYTYQFWKNKPTMKLSETYVNSEKIENLSERKIYSSPDPLKIPSSLSWNLIDINNDEQLNNFVNFLNENYKTGKKYKLSYSNSYLRWVLGNDNIILSLVENETKNIVGGIASCFKNSTVYNITDNFATVPYLCVHPKYRNKKMCGVLIDEVIRRIVQEKKCDKGFFATNYCVPSPVAYINYYHRMINFKLLNKVGIVNITNDNDVKKYEKMFQTGNKSAHDDNYVLLNEKYLQETLDIYNLWSNKFNIHQNYTLESFRETFINENVKTYVILNKDKKVVDFMSYYVLPYSLNEGGQINVAYLYTYTALEEPLKAIFDNLIKIAVNENFDLLTVSDLMNVSDVLLCRKSNITSVFKKEEYEKVFEYKFIKGVETKYFNLFNLTSPDVKSDQISLLIPN